ncbi:TetR/AcrR family transcriptional regulator [Aestuariibius sp. 2305UL40-4]|uniref:TetR/AcrR family transcriptional regulator n=1 Tax=Aestuariibius violaceus TaxID=3234132 RepID=UPI00345E43FB
MARPRTFDTDTVLSTVTDLFWARGYDAVSIQDLAKATGVRPGSLHAAFGNKRDLFERAFDRYGERFRTHMQVDLPGLRGASQYLDRLVTSAIDDPARKGCLIINTAGELEVHSVEIKAGIRDRLDTMKAFFRDRLEEDGVSSEEATNALFGAAVSILTLARAGQPKEVLQDIAAAAIGHVNAQAGNLPSQHA